MRMLPVQKSVVLSGSSFEICQILDPGVRRVCWRMGLLVFHQLLEVMPDLANPTPSPVPTGVAVEENGTM